MRRLLLLATLAAAAIGATVALAGPPSPDNPAGRSGSIFGIVPVQSLADSQAAVAGGNLRYHNGPVMHTNTTYAIYWVPANQTAYTMAAGYTTTLDGFFANVAAATTAHATSNVYFSDTQYYDGAGKIANTSTVGGSVIDTNPFPANGCTDTATKVCLSNAQIQTEIKKVMAAHGWTGGPTKLFFMFTPKNVGSCYSSSSCAFTSYCAYHSHSGTGASEVLYANQPYAAYVPSACDAGQHPNGNDADATINVASHEHNEAITDALGTAWYDLRGYENGDKCAWSFGTALGSTSFGRYNQVIGTGKYYLQQEWSNAHTRCVLVGT